MAVRTLRYNTFEGRTWKGATFVTDTDALAFCEAAQIYERNQQKAVVDLVRRLKTAGLWSKMKAIYPFIGGTATSHKFNLKDPRDVDAAFRLTFSGGWTHSANGALPNGTNAWADTFLSPSPTLALNSTHGSVYSRTNTNTIAPLLSGQDFVGTGNFTIWPRYGVSNDIYFRVNSTTSGPAGTNTSSAAYYIANRNSSTGTSNYRNNVNITQLQNSGTIHNGSIYLSRQATAYCDRELAFATIGDGLTDTDATNLYNIVDLYQKRLGRAV